MPLASPGPERSAQNIEIIPTKEEALGMNNKIGDDTGIKRLRTYKEDVAEALKKENDSR